jgi:hypothetical protein
VFVEPDIKLLGRPDSASKLSTYTTKNKNVALPNFSPEFFPLLIVACTGITGSIDIGSGEICVLLWDKVV